MSDFSKQVSTLPPEQQAIRAKCFHPTGTFIEFKKEEIEQSIAERFEKIVRMYPRRVAVKTRNDQLTYAELNYAANKLAQAILARRGVGQEPIGLLFPKGTPLIVATMGTLKAGKICMHMDPQLPHARLSRMLEDAQARLIVTNHEYFAMANALPPKNQCLNIDELDSSFRAENPHISLAPNALALIIYTSGSTGLPRGVIENHRNLLHYTMIETNDYHICAEDRLTFLASAGRDVFRAVLNGAAVYPMEIRQEGLTGLAHWLIQEDITIYNSVVSAFRHFVSALNGNEQFPHLRLVKLMGETVYRRDVELYQKHFAKDCIFVNLYGPNETGLLSHYLIDKGTQVTSSVVPVGYGVEGKEVLVLDENGNEVGFDQPGEIAVRSRYLSPGYWGGPDLTHPALFPASSGETERLYRTGDLGSMRSDGCLMHLGRKDFQVKIRGYRVEIAEVEMALMDLDVVAKTVVVAREDVSGHKRLIAYVVAQSIPAPTATTLRNSLGAKLPDYMIPSAFVVLDDLPFIGIGKVDRNALPVPGNSRPELDVRYAAPRTPIEEELSRIWAEVLSLDRVGIHDSFFHLGGDSLAATRLVSQVMKTFQLEVPLKVLFEAPTVADMAIVIAQNHTNKISQKELHRILRELENISNEEAEQLLAAESIERPGGNERNNR